MNLEHRAEDALTPGDEPRVHVFQRFRHLVKTKELSPFSRLGAGKCEQKIDQLV